MLSLIFPTRATFRGYSLLGHWKEVDPGYQGSNGNASGSSTSAGIAVGVVGDTLVLRATFFNILKDQQKR